MELFLIKIGKVFSQIKNIGFFNAGKKILSALYLMFTPAESGEILFITNGTGDSARYRTWNAAEELKIHGLKGSVTLQDNLWLSGYAKKFKVFIFHRVFYNPKIAKFIEEIKNRGGEIIFETDDLTFDPRYAAKTDNYAKLNAFEKKQYASGLGLEILKDPYVKICTTTTSSLAKILEGYGKKVFIVPNKLSNDDLKITDEIIKHKTLNIKHCCMLHASCSMISIGYFSGTKSHDRDFAAITDALTQIMEKYPDVRLVLAGPLDIGSKLNKFENKIERLPFASRKKHFENISKININLAPLEIGNPYCESKSELKFFEAGILEVPTVAAATQTFREAITDGVDGFLAGNTQEWTEKLEKLIADENLRKTMGEKARETALSKYSNKNSRNEEFYGYLKNKAGSIAG